MIADVSTSETICINLLHAAWSSIINATRLALYGAHVDALNLVRAALEATYHAEYFRDHPSDAAEWDKAGLIVDFEDRRKFLEEFSKNKRVRWNVEQKYLPDRSLSRFFQELSTYGSHANPVTVALHLSSNMPGIANLGFLSVGRSEAMRLCASHILHILSYALCEFHDSFGHYLSQNPSLTATYQQFQRDLATIRSGAPQGLSLLRWAP
ncbi:MAG: hypothetical protein HY690_15690 [Chloroflexi bacterium]|nr:hypothetical protein [Chloroflexota bacterium]